jgi:Altered inheritance of mitochondria 5
VEVLKDRWNSEVEKMVHNVQETDWNEKRELYERRIASVWSNVRATGKVQELEETFKENAVETAEQVREKAEAAKEASREKRLLELK